MSFKKPTVFTGVATALITPFSNGEIDYPALEHLIEYQIQGGIDAILVAGTTGESATLNFSEHGNLIAFAKEKIAGRLPLLAGCGSNCTQRAEELARIAYDAGADALLSVTPYYNKTSDTGILLHYERIANAVPCPVIVYNVPSRTGFSLKMKHYCVLADMENIVGVKEASGDLNLLSELVGECSDRLDVYTGNDDQTLAACRLGALGSISVYSNLFPQKAVKLMQDCKAGEWKKAAEKMKQLKPQMSALFCEVNPIPVKYLASRLGLCQEEYRLPLCPPGATAKAELDRIFSIFNH